MGEHHLRAIDGCDLFLCSGLDHAKGIGLGNREARRAIERKADDDLRPAGDPGRSSSGRPCPNALGRAARISTSTTDCSTTRRARAGDRRPGTRSIPTPMGDEEPTRERMFPPGSRVGRTPRSWTSVVACSRVLGFQVDVGTPTGRNRVFFDFKTARFAVIVVGEGVLAQAASRHERIAGYSPSPPQSPYRLLAAILSGQKDTSASRA